MAHPVNQDRVMYRLTFTSPCKDILPSVLQFDCAEAALKEIALRKRMGMWALVIERMADDVAERTTVGALRKRIHEKRPKLKV